MGISAFVVSRRTEESRGVRNRRDTSSTLLERESVILERGRNFKGTWTDSLIVISNTTTVKEQGERERAFKSGWLRVKIVVRIISM